MAKWPQFVTIWITNAKCVLNFSIYLIFKMGISFKHIPAIKLSFWVWHAINAIRKPQMLKTCANVTLQLENSIVHYFGILVLFDHIFLLFALLIFSALLQIWLVFSTQSLKQYFTKSQFYYTLQWKVVQKRRKKTLKKIKCEFMCSTIGYFIENKKNLCCFCSW